MILQNILLYTANEAQKRIVFSEQERKLGKKPVLNYAPYGMVKNFIKTPMDFPKKFIKSKHGIDFRKNPWMNYFTMAKPEKLFRGNMGRFNIENDNYQSWIGTYLFMDNGYFKDYNFEKLVMMPEADQSLWLRAFGVKNPVFSVDPCSVYEMKNPLNKKADVSYKFRIQTNSDVNERKEIEWFMKALLPGAKNKGSVSEKITLETIMCAWHEGEVLVMPYACATKENWPKVKNDYTKAMRSITTEPVKNGFLTPVWQSLSDAIVNGEAVA